MTLVNYRNFARTQVRLKPGVNTIIGENGSGKSNLFRAVRLMLDERFVIRRYALKEEDFHRGLENWRGHWIVLTLEFGNVSNDESVQSLLLHHAAEESKGSAQRATYSLVFRPNLEVRNKLAKIAKGDQLALEELRSTITIDDYEQLLVGKTSVDLSDIQEYKRIVGDFDSVWFPADEYGNAPSFHAELGSRVPREIALSREFSLSYVGALRNVTADFSDVRRNPLRTLLAEKSEQIAGGDYADIIRKISDLNFEIENRNDVQEITKDIHTTFKDTVGETYSPTSMQIHSELPLDAADLFKSLKLYIGENGDSVPRALHEMSLGGANLVYLTLKLLEFEYRTKRQAIANFLLIEEPEAHIHTHVQKTLFDRVNYEKTQIIYSTHSTHISEVSEIERVNVLSREGSAWVALQPAAKLEEPEIQAAQRFLDAVRSNLLFAKSVVLVEGDAEEILIPHLMRKVYGISLDEIGVSLVNVRSTGFETLARLFHEDRLRKRCAILTDHDQTFFSVNPTETDSDSILKRMERARRSAVAGAARKERLDIFQKDNDFVHVSYAPHTFEVDFANEAAANRAILLATVDDIYTQKSTRRQFKSALAKTAIASHGVAALALAERAKKGWFALLVSRKLDAADTYGGPVLPQYIVEGVGFGAQKLPDETWRRILNHRIEAWQKDRLAWNSLVSAHVILERLKDGRISVGHAIAELSQLDYKDPRIAVLYQAVEGHRFHAAPQR